MAALIRPLFVSCALITLSTSALAQDADGDLVPDSSDARPCDPEVAAVTYAPAADDHGLLLFEDQFPYQGDLDFNDVALSYRYRLELAPDGAAVRLVADLNPLALGGDYQSGLGLHLPVARDAVAGVQLTIEGQPSVDLPVSGNDAEATVDVVADMRAATFPGASGPVNVSGPVQQGLAMQVVFIFLPGTRLSISNAPFDIFVFRTLDRSHEIHRPEFSGTAQMDAGLFGTGEDDSTPGRSFTDVDGLPFALSLPTRASYPAEGEPISALYPNVVAFAASGGASDADFYTSSVQSAVAYPEAAAIRLAGPEHVDTSCVVPGQEPGNPGTMCLDLLAAGATTDGLYWIDPDGPGGRAPFEAYCDMSADGGGWTAIVAPADRSIQYLRRFDLLQDTLSGWSINSSYGVSWGSYVSSSNWSAGVWRFEAAVSFDEARITHSGWYNSPSGGLGNMMISSNSGQILLSNDAHTDSSRGQSLYLGGSSVFRLSRQNMVNRTDIVAAPGSTSLTAWMNAYTSRYGYTRRYIGGLWVR